MSTPTPPTPAAAAATAVNTDLINSLLAKQENIQNKLVYLNNAAANIADLNNQLTAVQNQLTALGYVAPAPGTPTV